MAETSNVYFLIFIGDSKFSLPGRSAIAVGNAEGLGKQGVQAGRRLTLGYGRERKSLLILITS